MNKYTALDIYILKNPVVDDFQCDLRFLNFIRMMYLSLKGYGVVFDPIPSTLYDFCKMVLQEFFDIYKKSEWFNVEDEGFAILTPVDITWKQFFTLSNGKPRYEKENMDNCNFLYFSFINEMKDRKVANLFKGLFYYLSRVQNFGSWEDSEYLGDSYFENYIDENCEEEEKKELKKEMRELPDISKWSRYCENPSDLIRAITDFKPKNKFQRMAKSILCSLKRLHQYNMLQYVVIPDIAVNDGYYTDHGSLHLLWKEDSEISSIIRGSVENSGYDIPVIPYILYEIYRIDGTKEKVEDQKPLILWYAWISSFNHRTKKMMSYASNR